MSATLTGLRRFLKRDSDHMPLLSHEQVRAQETYNAQLRGYGNNNSGDMGRPTMFAR